MKKRLSFVGLILVILFSMILYPPIMPKAYHRHIWSPWRTYGLYGCESSGYRSRHCYGCNARQDEDIPAPGHVWSVYWDIMTPTCVNSGSKTRRCLECNGKESFEIPPTGNHIYETWAIIKEPTVFREGVRKRRCGGCDLYQTEYIEKLKADVTLKYKTLKIRKGAISTKLKVKKKAKGDRVASWTSSKKKIATVNKKNGKITTKRKGVTYIYVKMKSGASAKCKIIVR